MLAFLSMPNIMPWLRFWPQFSCPLPESIQKKLSKAERQKNRNAALAFQGYVWSPTKNQLLWGTYRDNQPALQMGSANDPSFKRWGCVLIVNPSRDGCQITVVADGSCFPAFWGGTSGAVLSSEGKGGFSLQHCRPCPSDSFECP